MNEEGIEKYNKKPIPVPNMVISDSLQNFNQQKMQMPPNYCSANKKDITLQFIIQSWQILTARCRIAQRELKFRPGASLVAQTLKNPPAMWETQIGFGRSPGGTLGLNM